VNGACTEIHADTDKAAKEQIAKRPGFEPGRRYRLRILKSVLRAADFHVGLASLDDGCAGRGQLPHALRVDKIAIGPRCRHGVYRDWLGGSCNQRGASLQSRGAPPKAINHAYFIRLLIIVPAPACDAGNLVSSGGKPKRSGMPQRAVGRLHFCNGEAEAAQRGQLMCNMQQRAF